MSTTSILRLSTSGMVYRSMQVFEATWEHFIALPVNECETGLSGHSFSLDYVADFGQVLGLVARLRPDGVEGTPPLPAL
jgi:hypothetical protein